MATRQFNLKYYANKTSKCDLSRSSAATPVPQVKIHMLKGLVDKAIIKNLTKHKGSNES